MNKIKKEDKISEVIKNYPNSIEVFFDFGMSCIGCPMASQETIEGGCASHGMSKEKIDELIKKLNESIEVE